MTRTHTLVCLLGLGLGVVVAVVFGVAWGAVLSVAALLACPAAMYLAMRQMAARPDRGQGSGGLPPSHEPRNTGAHVSETRQTQ